MRHDINRSLALRYAASGFSVFPCSADTKRPLIKWRDGSTSDAAAIARMWHRWPHSFVGIDLAKCGLVVLDADRHRPAADGVAAVSTLFRQHRADLTAVPVTQTPGNGFHFYFRQPAEPLGNRAGDLPEGVDVRGSGGFTITPHCIRPDGKAYRSLPGYPDLMTAFKAGTIPVVPTWLVEIIRPKPRAAEPIIITTQRGRRFECYAATALDRMARDLSAKPTESGRNEALNLIAWKMGTMVARGWIGRAEVEHVLDQAATSCHLVKDTSAREVRATIASGLNAGISRPHPDLKDR
jgi:hypothetical protein